MSERRALPQIRGRAEEDDLAAALPGSRAEVEDAVRRAHDPGVVLDHQQRVPGVAQPVQDADHPPDVAGVEPDARLVEDEEGVHERGAQRRRQVDALDLAAGERARLPVERQVAEADVDEVPEAGADLAQQQVRRLVERPGQRERAEEPLAARDREQRQLVQVEPLVPEAPEQRLRPAAARRRRPRRCCRSGISRAAPGCASCRPWTRATRSSGARRTRRPSPTPPRRRSPSGAARRSARATARRAGCRASCRGARGRPGTRARCRSARGGSRRRAASATRPAPRGAGRCRSCGRSPGRSGRRRPAN